MLPIVQRELTVAARNPKLHPRRLRWGILQVLATGGILLLSAGASGTGAAERFFFLASNLALLLCLFEGVRKTSDCISSEKREGTLGFLFLSNLSGTDVVLGKFIGALLRSLSVLLPFLPILATSLLLGGTTLGEFWRVALALVVTLFASLSICLFVSTISRERSIVAALLAIGALVVLPLLVGPVTNSNSQAALARMLNPFAALGAAQDLRYSARAVDYWCGMGGLFALSVVALAGASLLVRRVSREKLAKNRNVKRSGGQKPGKRRKLLDANPVLWLAYNERGRLLVLILSASLTLAGLVPLVYLWGNEGMESVFPAAAAGVLLLFIWLNLAVESSTSIAEAKNNGSLELILSTPLAVEQVLSGFYGGLWKRYRIPIGCSFILILTGFLLVRGTEQSVWLAKSVVELFLQIPVIATVGTWMGLRSKTRAAAVVYTILLAAIVPWIVCVFTIFIQIVLIAQATEDSKRILRRIRTASHWSEADSKLQPPALSQNIPPVLR